MEINNTKTNLLTNLPFNFWVLFLLGNGLLPILSDLHRMVGFLPDSFASTARNHLGSPIAWVYFFVSSWMLFFSIKAYKGPKKWKRSTAGVMSIIWIVAAILMFGKINSPTANIKDLFKQSANSLSERLPIKVDEVTEVTSVKFFDDSTGFGLHYHYSSSLTLQEIDKEKLYDNIKNDFIQSMCKKQKDRQFLENGLLTKRTYTFIDGQKPLSYTFGKDDCLDSNVPINK